MRVGGIESGVVDEGAAAESGWQGNAKAKF